MGVNLVAGGATCKVWAPSAQAVYINGTFAGTSLWDTNANPDLLLTMNAAGYWTGFIAGAAAGDNYKYYVVGAAGGGAGYKRDPYARELTPGNSFPIGVNCIIRSPAPIPGTTRVSSLPIIQT